MRAIIPDETLLTARPFNGPGWSVEWQKSLGCSLTLHRRRWHVLSYYPERATDLRRRVAGRVDAFSSPAGSLGLYPARTAETVEWHGAGISALHIHFAPERLAAISPGLAGVRRLACFRDAELSRLCGGLYEMARAERLLPAGVPPVMDSLIAHIAERYASAELQTDSLLGRRPLTALLDRMYGPAAVETTVDQLAADAGVSRGYFFRAFRRHVGATPHGLLLRSRLELAKGRIQAGDRLADIALASGFADQSHFSNAFRQTFGLSAGAFSDWFRR